MNLVQALGKGDAQSREARAVLARRGVTDAALREIRAVCMRTSTLEDVKLPAPRVVVRADAEERAWAWYQEWSTIARARIRDGRLLRRLGFGKRGRPAGSTKASAVEAPA